MNERETAIAADQRQSYFVDGNALFFTAAEAAWRRATGPHFQGGGIVVAVGYILKGRVFSPNRDHDLTPPSRDAAAEGAAYGGAEAFLTFIQDVVKPFIAEEVLSGSTIGREALFGHSFGGLFGLYALYTRPLLFDCVMASSPSIFWSEHRILEYEKLFLEGDLGDQKNIAVPRCPTLMLSVGSWEQHVPRWAGEAESDYRKRRAGAEGRAMEDNAKALYSRLRESSLLCAVSFKKYPEEDHGTVIACAVSRFLTTFFEEWAVSDLH